MELVNLTPHPITLHRKDGTTITIAPEPTPARVATTTREVGAVDGIPLVEEHYGKVTGLPEAKQGVVYVVSRPVVDACPERRDLLVVTDTVRDDQGRVTGARALARLRRPGRVRKIRNQ